MDGCTLRNSSKDTYYDDMNATMVMIIAAMVSITSSLGFIINLTQTIPRFINPEFYAIQYIIHI
jgi:hypothetical protein